MRKMNGVLSGIFAWRVTSAIWWILAIALVARLIALLVLPDQNFPDAGSYRAAGAEFRDLQLMTNTDIMPLYPLLVTFVGAGLGQKLADLLFSLAAVWLIYAISIRIYHDEMIALFAAMACAVWPHFIFFAAVGLTESLFIALTFGGMLCLCDERYGWGSVLLVLGILTRPVLEPFAPLAVVLFALFVHRRSLRFALQHLAIYVLIYLGLMAPWWIHNFERFDEFVRLNLAGGMVLYTGNNPMNQSGGGITGRDVDFTAFRGIVNPVRRSEAFNAAAIGFIKAEPEHFIAMMPVKFMRLWQPLPYAKEYRSRLVTAVSLVAFLPSIVLALIGLISTLPSYFRSLVPWLAYVSFLTLVHVVTFGSVRYRIPMEPIVLVLAAAGLVTLLRQFAGGRRLLTRLLPTMSANQKS